MAYFFKKLNTLEISPEDTVSLTLVSRKRTAFNSYTEDTDMG